MDNISDRGVRLDPIYTSLVTRRTHPGLFSLQSFKTPEYDIIHEHLVMFGVRDKMYDLLLILTKAPKYSNMAALCDAFVLRDVRLAPNWVRLVRLGQLWDFLR